jgi:flagellar motor switch protein FliN/FliY
VNADDALIELADSTAQAIAQVLETVSGVQVVRSAPLVLASGSEPLGSIPVPAVVSSVSYVDGVTGGNVLVMTRLGVQRLAAAMMGMDGMAVEGSDELSELDLSAASEAMNQMMAAAAGATSVVLNEEVEISPPETHVYHSSDEAAGRYEPTPHMTSVGLTLMGESCRLIQLVPNAFVVRMTRALDELEAQEANTQRSGAGGVPPVALQSVPVRISAELGRTRMPVGRAVGLATGAVVDLDRAPDDPIDVFVNGRRLATGRLLLVDDDWAVRIETMYSTTLPDKQPEGGSI